jgi:hypothetical protein
LQLNEAQKKFFTLSMKAESGMQSEAPSSWAAHDDKIGWEWLTMKGEVEELIAGAFRILIQNPL